jgi:hypothetical protein
MKMEAGMRAWFRSKGAKESSSGFVRSEEGRPIGLPGSNDESGGTESLTKQEEETRMMRMGR